MNKLLISYKKKFCLLDQNHRMKIQLFLAKVNPNGFIWVFLGSLFIFSKCLLVSNCNTYFSPFPHYSKSQIFVQKFNFDKTPTISRVFHPNFFWQFFSWNQSCQQLKSPKPQHFHEFFTPKKKSTIFLENQSWIFGQKMKISNSVKMRLF